MDYEARAKCAIREGRHDDIVDLFDQAERAGGATPKLRVWRANLYRHAGDLTQALGLYETALHQDATLYAAWYNCGACHADLGDHKQAARCFERSLARPGGHRPSVIRLGECIEHLGRPELARELYEDAAQMGLLIHPLQRSMHYQPGLRAQPFWDPAQLPALASADTARIVDEVERTLAQHLPNQWNSPALHAGHWSKLFFGFKGALNPSHRGHCPALYALLDSLPGLAQLEVGNQCVSVLTGGTVIRPHCGPTNTRLRCHLGIDIPPSCILTVAGESRTWERGQWLVFDDSFEHGAANHSTQDRTILIVDIWHPDCAPPGAKRVTAPR